MAKTLSIIVPYFTETEDVVFPLLSSINNQVGVDFNRIECILVNDGNGNEFSGGFLKLFHNLSIKCVLMDENKGPGVARQTGIDSAKGEYIMFCDADDILHNVGVLGAFLNEIDAKAGMKVKPDILTSLWLEELYNGETNAYSYITHEDEATWMHGKAFRRFFINGNNIRFHDDLRVHEDSYFLGLAFAMTDNKWKLPFTSYVWKYLPNSITRRNGAAYTYDSMPEFNRAVGLSFKELERRGYGEMDYKVIQFIMYNYFILHQSHWLTDENKERLALAEGAFWEMIKPFMSYYHEADERFVAAVYNEERSKSFRDGVETETLLEWLARIGEKCC